MNPDDKFHNTPYTNQQVFDTVKKIVEEKQQWGGKREGAGRKEGKSKESIQVTIDADILEWIDKLGGKRSSQINKILKTHIQRIEQLIREAETLE